MYYIISYKNVHNKYAKFGSIGSESHFFKILCQVHSLKFFLEGVLVSCGENNLFCPGHINCLQMLSQDSFIVFDEFSNCYQMVLENLCFRNLSI